MTTDTPLESILPAEQNAEPAQTETVVEPTQEASEPSTEQAMVPKAALDEARGKARRYTEEVNYMRDERTARIEQMLARQQQPQQQKPPDWYENPEAATMYAVQRATSPYLQRFQQVLHEHERAQHANAQMIAESRFGEDAVNAAEQAFLEAVHSKRIDAADYTKVVNHPNRYAAAVQWHKRLLAQQEIGDDPAAYRKKLEEQIRSEIEAERGGQGKPVMPSNFAAARNVGSRSGPAWSGPKSLNEIFKS